MLVLSSHESRPEPVLTRAQTKAQAEAVKLEITGQGETDELKLEAQKALIMVRTDATLAITERNCPPGAAATMSGHATPAGRRCTATLSLLTRCAGGVHCLLQAALPGDRPGV